MVSRTIRVAPRLNAMTVTPTTCQHRYAPLTGWQNVADVLGAGTVHNLVRRLRRQLPSTCSRLWTIGYHPADPIGYDPTAARCSTDPAHDPVQAAVRQARERHLDPSTSKFSWAELQFVENGKPWHQAAALPLVP